MLKRGGGGLNYNLIDILQFISSFQTSILHLYSRFNDVMFYEHMFDIVVNLNIPLHIIGKPYNLLLVPIRSTIN